jgi:hypothetical protein
VIFFLVITPLGLGARLLGHDPMRRKRKDCASYWTDRAGERSRESYFRQS